MPLTPRELNRATLARQLLLRREPVDVVEAVRRLVALQGQHPASPYLALWNRLARFDPADVDARLAAGVLVKATLLRRTLHVVPAPDLPTLHAAMRPTVRASVLGDSRFVASGLAAEDVDALVPALLDHLGSPRTSGEVRTWLASRAPGAEEMAWWALRQSAPLRHAPTGGPWSFGPRPSYLASGPGPSGPPSGSVVPPAPDACLEILVVRYLAAYGPATVADVAQFARIPRGRARVAADHLVASGDLRPVGDAAGAGALLDVPDGPRPPAQTPAPPRLLGMWDNVLLAYADRARLIPPEYRAAVIRSNGDVLPTLLVDGYVAGVWRPVEDGVEATAFHRLPDDVWAGLADEAASLRALLADREPRVYSRYGFWWASLPAAETRLLAGG